MERTLDDLWAPVAHWCHFSLNDRPGPYHFPAVARTHVPASPTAAPTAAPPAPRGSRGRRPQRRRDTRSPSRSWSPAAPTITAAPSSWSACVAAAAHNHALLDRRRHRAHLHAGRVEPGARASPAGGRGRRAAAVLDPRLRRRSGVARGDLDQPAPAVHGVLRQERGGAALDGGRDPDDELRRLPVQGAGGPSGRGARSRTSTSIAPSATTSIATATGAPGGEAVLADPRHHVRVNQLSAPEFSNAAGDFLLLTRATWRRLRGFNETVRFAKIHKDGQFCHRAWIEGLTFDTLGPIWHLDHDGSYSNAGALRGSPDAPYGPEWAWRERLPQPGRLGAPCGDRGDGRGRPRPSAAIEPSRARQTAPG